MLKNRYAKKPVWLLDTWAHAHVSRSQTGFLAYRFFSIPDFLAYLIFSIPGFLVYLDYVFCVFWGLCFAFWWFYENKKMRDVRTIILAAVSRRDLCFVSENEGFRFGGAHVLSGSDFLNAISYFWGPIWFSDPTFLFFWPGKSESEFLMTTFSYTRIWVYGVASRNSQIGFCSAWAWSTPGTGSRVQGFPDFL